MMLSLPGTYTLVSICDRDVIFGTQTWKSIGFYQLMLVAMINYTSSIGGGGGYMSGRTPRPGPPLGLTNWQQ